MERWYGPCAFLYVLFMLRVLLWLNRDRLPKPYEFRRRRLERVRGIQAFRNKILESFE